MKTNRSDFNTIAVIMSCHNRKDKTLRCLRHLYQQSVLKHKQCKISVYLLDDGSTDQTSQSVSALFPDTHIIFGDGNLYWNGGMHTAFSKALKQDYDYYLWLNDDTFLYTQAVHTLLTIDLKLQYEGNSKSIIIGSTVDPRTKKFSYGGFQRIGKLSPLKFSYVQPDGTLKECTTMCGNCVLISREVVQLVGNLDTNYRHRWGDTDYGLRAREKGCKVWVAPNYVGECENNELAEAWTDATLDLRERVKIFNSIKGYHKQDWYHYVKRHGGRLWLLLWIKPYVDMFITSCLQTLTIKKR